MHRTPTRRSPLPDSRTAAGRRRLVAGCVAVAAVLGLSACGTASGALQPTATASTPGASAPGATTPGATTPGATAQQPTGTAAATIAPTPGSDAAGPGRAAPPAGAEPRTPTAAATPGHAPATGTPVGTTPAGTPAAPPAQPGQATKVIGSTASGGRTVALTFDDGPGPATGQILDLLAQYHVKATFCEIGQNAAANPALVKRVLAEGHRLCDHSVHHPQPFEKLPHDKAVYEISAARDMIVKAGGPGTRVSWFRAPGGGFTADNEHIAAGLGMDSLGWSVDPRDWSRPGVAAIVSTVQSQLKPGGVILMHDGGGDRSQTVAALKQLLPWLVAQGYTFDFPAA
ncbi:polysaccharide deacetylase family protein [Kitasatospora sp. NPDC028055]|uniref:polysaccharide deacetylase family protein n=1 Tax=Kitasatospora sp. NPDC028055 TaxID=3155653 RepID=UPI0033D999B5